MVKTVTGFLLVIMTVVLKKGSELELYVGAAWPLCVDGLNEEWLCMVSVTVEKQYSGAVNSGIFVKVVDMLAVIVIVVVLVFGKTTQTVEGSPDARVISQVAVLLEKFTVEPG